MVGPQGVYTGVHQGWLARHTTSAPFSEFGVTLRALREARGYSRAILARRLGCHERVISRWEAGRYLPPPRWWPRLVAALGLSAGELGQLMCAAFDPDDRDDLGLWSAVAGAAINFWSGGPCVNLAGFPRDRGRSLAACLRERRRRLRFSQPRMAAWLDVPLATWRNWERGRRLPALSTLALVLRGHAGPSFWSDLLMGEARNA